MFDKNFNVFVLVSYAVSLLAKKVEGLQNIRDSRLLDGGIGGCKALIAECEACAQSMTLGEFCEHQPQYLGCETRRLGQCKDEAGTEICKKVEHLGLCEKSRIQENCKLPCKVCQRTKKNSFGRVCKLAVDIGRCKAKILKYFFKSTSGKCDQFYYGGCGGNENNFETKEECEQSCILIDLKSI